MEAHNDSDAHSPSMPPQMSPEIFLAPSCCQCVRSQRPHPQRLSSGPSFLRDCGLDERSHLLLNDFDLEGHAIMESSASSSGAASKRQGSPDCPVAGPS